jgi:hypothetical protein
VESAGDRLPRNPIAGTVGFCARATSDQATVEPAITLMKSRRLMQPLRLMPHQPSKLKSAVLADQPLHLVKEPVEVDWIGF